VNRHAATPLIAALSPGHSDINRFHPLSLISSRQDIIWIAPAEKIPKVAHTTGTVDVFDQRSGISGPTSRRAELIKSDSLFTCYAVTATDNCQ
jgi:hypothetical protein